MSWFEVKVSYSGVDDREVHKTLKEVYLVDAVSCTEAEVRTVSHLRGFSGVEVTSVRACQPAVNESENGYDGIYIAKIAYVTYDGDKGKERRSVVSYLYPADDIQSAIKKAEDIGGVDMSEVVSVSLSKYAGFIPYEIEQ